MSTAHLKTEWKNTSFQKIIIITIDYVVLKMTAR